MTNPTDLYGIADRFAREVGDTGLASYDSDDVRQDAVYWLLAHPKSVRNALLPDGTYRYQRLMSFLRRALAPELARRRTAERQPARHASTYDEAMLELVLPVVWDPNHTPQVLVDEGETRRGQSNPHAFARWMAMVVDVKRAYQAVALTSSLSRRAAMYRYYLLGQTYVEVAEAAGVSRRTATEWIQDFVAEMLEVLNGAPQEPRVMRQVMSNAAAQAKANAEYNEGAA